MKKLIYILAIFSTQLCFGQSPDFCRFDDVAKDCIQMLEKSGKLKNQAQEVAFSITDSIVNCQLTNGELLEENISDLLKNYNSFFNNSTIKLQCFVISSGERKAIAFMWYDFKTILGNTNKWILYDLDKRTHTDFYSLSCNPNYISFENGELHTYYIIGNEKVCSPEEFDGTHADPCE